MKIFCYLIVFVGVLFACSREVDTTEHLYFCNTLDENVKIISEEIIKEMQEVEKAKADIEATKIVETIKLKRKKLRF